MSLETPPMKPKVIFKNISNNFIETGSFNGDGIQIAIDCGFTNITSIEITDKYCDVCRERFKNNKGVTIVKGDSITELRTVLDKNKDLNYTYWLDGHWSCEDTGFGQKEFPIMEELEAILCRPVVNEIIYIDDMRILRAFDKEINTDKIVEMVGRYRCNAKISFLSTRHDEQDIMVIEY